MPESGKKVAKKKLGNGEGKISEDTQKLIWQRVDVAKQGWRGILKYVTINKKVGQHIQNDKTK